MIRLLHLADLHLGWLPRFIADPVAARRYADARHGVFSAAVAFALDPGNRIDAVVIAGDLFDDHRPAPATVEQVIGGLGQLVARGIEVLTVPGNHDELTYGDSVYRIHGARWPGTLVRCPAMEHVLTVQCRGGEAFFYAMAYTGGVTQSAHPVARFPRVGRAGAHIAVMHGTIVGAAATAPGWAMHERSLPIDGTALAAAGYDYVALGHIHRPGPAGGSGASVAYAGLAAGRGFDDPGCGYLSVIGLSPQAGAPQLSRVALDLPAVARLEVRLDGASTTDEVLIPVLQAIAAFPAGALLDVELTGYVGQPVDPAALTAAIASRAQLLHVAVHDRTSILGADLIRRWAGEITLRGFFVRRLLATATDDGPESAVPVEERRIADRALRHGLAALERGKR